MNQQVPQVSPSTDASHLEHLGLLGGVALGWWISAEVLYLPKVALSDGSYQQYGLALRSSVGPADYHEMPVHFAVRGFYANSQFTFNQNLTDPISLQSVDVTGTNSMSVTGAQIFLSPAIPIPVFEVCIGAGYLRATGSLSLSGPTNATLFTFTPEQVASSTLTTPQLFAGIQSPPIFDPGTRIGFEWSRAFGTDSFTWKLCRYF